jgi:CubicO group peptidase (beta-lactamase class C family)
MSKSLTNFDDYINQALADWHIPGAAVAITQGDQTLHLSGHGLRDIEKNLPVTEHTRFPIASMTKPFTAMGAALLVDEGLLDWDKPIRDVMPEFRLHDEYATQHATLRDLLSHRTGLPRHDATWYGNAAKPRMEAIKELRHLKPNAPFRSLFQYNNLMFEAVGHLCAVVTESDSWETFLQERILNPLGLNNTTPNYDSNGKTFDDIAQPYRWKLGGTTPQIIPFYQNALGPAGSMYSTLSDMVTWIKVHAQQGMFNGEAFVSPYNLKQMHIPHTLIAATTQQERLFNNNVFAYGLGWFIEPYNGATLIHHGGNIDGFSLMAAFVPQEDLTVVVLTNIDGKGLRSALLYEAVDRALGREGRNWSSDMLSAAKVTQEAALKSNASTAADRLSDAPATHALKDYAGHYAAPAYEDIHVEWKDNALRMFFYGEYWPLEHYQHNIFELDMSSRFDEKLKVTFDLDKNSHIICLNLPIEPAIGDMAFTKKPLEPTPEQMALWVGEYDFPAEGQDITVSVDDGVLSLALTGDAKKVLQCIELGEQKSCFMFEDDSESVVAFWDGGLSIKSPGAFYECARKL